MTRLTPTFLLGTRPPGGEGWHPHVEEATSFGEAVVRRIRRRIRHAQSGAFDQIENIAIQQRRRNGSLIVSYTGLALFNPSDFV